MIIGTSHLQRRGADDAMANARVPRANRIFAKIGLGTSLEITLLRTMAPESTECVDCVPDGVAASAHQPDEDPATGVQSQYDPLNPATFVPPKANITPSVIIEFCERVGAMISRVCDVSAERKCLVVSMVRLLVSYGSSGCET